MQIFSFLASSTCGPGTSHHLHLKSSTSILQHLSTFNISKTVVSAPCMHPRPKFHWNLDLTVKESDSATVFMVIVLVVGVGGIFMLFAVMALCYRLSKSNDKKCVYPLFGMFWFFLFETWHCSLPTPSLGTFACLALQRTSQFVPLFLKWLFSQLSPPSNFHFPDWMGSFSFTLSFNPNPFSLHVFLSQLFANSSLSIPTSLLFWQFQKYFRNPIFIKPSEKPTRI